MRIFTLLISLLTLAACSTSYNATLYPYQDNRSQFAKSSLQHLMIASSNYGLPSRHYLTRFESTTDEYVQAYLKKHGKMVHGNKSFEQQWKNAQDRFGPVFNATTGQKTQVYDEALAYAASQVFANNPSLEAIIFTDLIETPVQYQLASKRYADWHGVRRRVKLEGIGEGIPENFDWSEKLDGISLGITIINRELNVVFHSVGGIQVAQALMLGNNTAHFKRRNDLFNNANEINEAIALAFHPFITMKNYPSQQ